MEAPFEWTRTFSVDHKNWQHYSQQQGMHCCNQHQGTFTLVYSSLGMRLVVAWEQG